MSIANSKSSIETCLKRRILDSQKEQIKGNHIKFSIKTKERRKIGGKRKIKCNE